MSLQTNVLCYACRRKVRDSVTEAIAEVPDNCLRSGMQPVVDTLVNDIARDLVAVSACARTVTKTTYLDEFSLFFHADLHLLHVSRKAKSLLRGISYIVHTFTTSTLKSPNSEPVVACVGLLLMPPLKKSHGERTCGFVRMFVCSAVGYSRDDNEIRQTGDNHDSRSKARPYQEVFAEEST